MKGKILVVLITVALLSIGLFQAVPALAAGPGGEISGAAGMPPDQSGTSVQSTISVSDDVITITPADSPSVSLVAPSDTAVSIIYDDTAKTVQQLVLKGTDQTIPEINAENKTTVAAILSVSYNVITITPADSLSVSLVAPSDTAVSIFYDSTTGEIQELKISNSEQAVSAKDNGNDESGKGVVGWFQKGLNWFKNLFSR